MANGPVQPAFFGNGHVLLANGHVHRSLGQRPRWRLDLWERFWPTAIFNWRADEKLLTRPLANLVNRGGEVQGRCPWLR